MASTAAGVGAVHTALALEPSLYLPLDPRVSTRTIAIVGVLGFALGCGLGARLVRNPWRVLAPSVLALAMVTAASGATYFALFGRGGPLGVVALGLGLVTGAISGVSLTCAFRALVPILLRLRALERLADPFRLALGAIAAGLAASALSHIGPLRGSLVLGMLLAGLAAQVSPLFWFLERRVLRGARAVRALAFVGLLGCLGGFALSLRAEPLGEAGVYPNPVIWRHATEHREYVVTSGQEALELSVDGRIKASSVDGKRYSQALVQPAMALAPHRAHVLVLDGGTGLVEREVLRHDDVVDITLVVDDRAIVELGRRQQWLRRLSGDALASPKIRVVEAEPIVFLTQTPERFDLAIADLPDPEGFLEGKNYTRYFFEKLRERLAPDGVIAVQASSPFAMPEILAGVEATVRAGGFFTLPYHAPVPTFGDWGYVLGAKAGPIETQALAGASAYLDGVTLDELEYLPKDLRTNEIATPSRLDDQDLVDTFQRVRRRAGF